MGDKPIRGYYFYYTPYLLTSFMIMMDPLTSINHARIFYDEAEQYRNSRILKNIF